MPVNKAVASGNGNRILTQKLHFQIANNPRSPQCQTEAELCLLPDPYNFSLPSTFKGWWGWNEITNPKMGPCDEITNL